MLDLKFIRENPEKVKENIKKKFQDEKTKSFNSFLEYFFSNTLRSS